MSEFQAKKKFSARNALAGAWNGTYKFVQPKTKRLVRPMVYVTLGAAAILGIQNKDDVKGSVDPETPTIKATLIDKPVFLEPQTLAIDENTEERLPAAVEAKILICEDVSENGKQCDEATIFYNEQDVVKNRVKVNGDEVRISEKLFESNQTRPWIRVNKER